MHDRLNIPLSPTPTRRVDRRVLWLFVNCAVAGIVACLAYQLWISRDLTSAWRPEGVQTVQILKNAKTSKLLHEHLGSTPIIAGTPWSIDDILSLSKREFSVHFDETGIVGFTTDHTAAADTIQAAKNYQLATATQSGRSYFGKIPASSEPSYTFSLNLWHEGVIFDSNHVKVGTLQVSDTGLTVNGLGLDPGPDTIGQKQPLLAAVSWPANSIKWPQMMEFGLGISEQRQLIEQIIEVGASVSYSEDDHGQTVILFVPTMKFSADELARLGKELMSRLNLTTLELTNPDGSSVLELFSNSNRITSQVEINEGVTIITLVDETDQGYKIIKNSQGIYILNRLSLEINNQTSPKSSCFRAANSFLQPKRILTPTSQLMIFSEIAWNKSTTRLCW
jgi:hypothetical protein